VTAAGPAHGWVAVARQTVLFALGVFVVLDAVLSEGTHVSEMIVGLLLLGLVPLDALMARLGRPS